jgi:flagellar motor component MotA
MNEELIDDRIWNLTWTPIRESVVLSLGEVADDFANDFIRSYVYACVRHCVERSVRNFVEEHIEEMNNE